MAQASIDSAFQSAIEAGKISGAIFCATDSAGHYTYERCIGERTLLSGAKQPYQLDNICYLASATKLMTSIAALQCVEDGILTLDGDLSSVAPELSTKQVLTGFSEDGTPFLEPQKTNITLRMLITHSSGLAYHFIDPRLMRYRKETGYVAQNGKFKVEESFQDPLVFQPGEGWMYSGGLDWAGRIVERVTQQPLIERMQERMFKPIGISKASFYPITDEVLRAQAIDVNPTDPQGTGKAVAGGDASMNTRTDGAFGGHGLFMPVEDYTKVLHSILSNDGKLLKPETVKSMFEAQLSSAAKSSLEQALLSPTGVFFRVGIDAGAKADYGLGGLLTLEDVTGWYGAHTLTWGGGQTFAWFIDPKNDLCGVGAIQTNLPIDMQLIADLKQTFRHDIYRQRDEWRRNSKA